MSLADRLKAERPEAPKPKFEQWIEGLDPADRAALVEASTDPAWSIAGLLRVVRAEGCVTSKETISAWRKSNGFAG